MAHDHARAVQRSIEHALSASYALAALVRQGKVVVSDFAATAQEPLLFYPGAASLQLAPGGIVRQIVPLAGNEKAIGRNQLQDPARNKEAILARDIPPSQCWRARSRACNVVSERSNGCRSFLAPTSAECCRS